MTSRRALRFVSMFVALVVAFLIVAVAARSARSARYPQSTALPFIKAYAADDLTKACSYVSNPKACKIGLSTGTQDKLTNITYVGQEPAQGGYTIVGYTGVDLKRNVVFEIIVYEKRVGKNYIITGVDPIPLSNAPTAASPTQTSPFPKTAPKTTTTTTTTTSSALKA